MEPLGNGRELSRAWQAVLGRLEVEVNKHNFNTWLRDTRPLHASGNVVTVQARTAMNCDWLNQRLTVVVHRAASAIFGDDVRVEFVPRGAEPPAEAPSPEAPPAQPAAGPLVGSVNSIYTFQAYVPADGNRLALQSCVALLDDPDLRISPVVIFGAPGLGKTHLLHALAGRATAAGWAVACLSAEEFTNRYMMGFRGGKLEEFQRALRGVRLLIIDDLQYLAGKTGTLDELVHTIDAVTNNGGHVVVASERHPFDLDLPDRLASRLAGGIVTRVEPFLLAERRRFIEQAARRHRVALPGWAIERIAGCEAPSVRLLQGAVNAAVSLHRSEMLDQRNLDAALTRISVAAVSPGALEDRCLLDTIARYFEVSLDELTGRSRKPLLTQARAIAVAALKERGRSNADVAEVLGGRDRSTISQAADRGRELLEAEPRLQSQLAG
jgi:chromosomal replication initiator protein